MAKLTILFIVVYIFGIISTIVISPAWGFYLYELVYFLNPNNRWWAANLPDLSYSFFLVLVMLIVFMHKYKQHSNTIRDMPEAKWFVIILICYGVASIFAVNPAMNSRFMGYLINTYVVMFIAFHLLDTEKKVELALFFFLIGSAYIGYEAMNVGRDSMGRVEGIGTVDTPNSNSVSASLVPVIPLVLYFCWLGGMKIRIVATIAGVIVVNGLVLMNSRGAFLGVMAGSGYFVAAMMFSKVKLPKQRAFIVLMVLASAAVAFRLIDETFIERMLTLQDQTTVNDSGSGSRRIHFWLATFDLLRDHPFGAGIYGFETLSPIYLHDPTFFDQTVSGVRERAVHSLWFQCLSEIGWLGFAAFMMLLYTLYRHLKRAKNILVQSHNFKQYYLLIAIEAGMLGFLVSGSFINMFRTQILYWMLLFAISGSVVMIRIYGNAGTDENCHDISNKK